MIKEKLKVDMKGGVVACHRLRNKNRVIVKFQDMDDRNNVYQAKFNQKEGAAGVIIHENLTDKRARQVKVFSDMKQERDNVVNYHTKNGIIFARNAREKGMPASSPGLPERRSSRLWLMLPSLPALETEVMIRKAGSFSPKPWSASLLALS